MQKTTDIKKLKLVLDIEQQLAEIKDVDVLLENILTGARRIANADAGSIYEYKQNANQIIIRFGQNETQQKKLAPGEKMPYLNFTYDVTPDKIAGYCVLSGKKINIPDVYNMPEYLDEEKTVKRPYSFFEETDKKTGYHTKSMLTIPLKMTNGRILGVLQIINARDDDGNVISFTEDDEFNVTRFATNASQALEYAYLTNSMVLKMAKMAESRDPKETGAHVERVSVFSLEIYDRYAINHNIPMNERSRYRDNLKLAAKCHDFGKVGISDLILKKPARFTDEERSKMKTHTCIGAQYFTPPESEVEEMAREICLCHHERWDGSEKGYPGHYDYMLLKNEESLPHAEPLKGEEIPLSARIVALADVFDALSHQRVYKEAWTLEDTFAEIEKERGLQFDPEVVDAFLQIKERIISINALM